MAVSGGGSSVTDLESRSLGSSWVRAVMVSEIPDLGGLVGIRHNEHIFHVILLLVLVAIGGEGL